MVSWYNYSINWISYNSYISLNMERTKEKTNGHADPQTIEALQQRIHTLSMITARATLATRLGLSYGNDRDIYQALGYKLDLTWDDYYAQYTRQDAAKAIIDRPVQATWQGEFGVLEAKDDKETQFEKAWKVLDDKLKFKAKFSRLDRLTGIGDYGILLLGLDDVKRKEDYLQPVTGKRKLLYIMPFGSGHAKISKWESRPANERYGQPLTYDIEVSNAEGTSSSTLRVHHSRVIHIVDNPLENEVKGTPRLEAVFNRLKDIEKVIGGSAEMFWRGARPGYQAKVDPDYTMTQPQIDDLQNQIDEYENNLRRILKLEGVSMDSLEMQVASPKDHVDIQIQMISMVTGIPKRILTGSERGELSSGQDKSEWLTWVKNRRGEFAEPVIVRPFVDRCIEYGILPKPKNGEYSVEWEDLFSASEKEKAEVGKIRAGALKDYVTQNATYIIPPEAFMKYFLGFDDDAISQIQEMLEAVKAEEPEVTPEEQAMLAEEERQRQLLEQQNQKVNE